MIPFQTIAIPHKDIQEGKFTLDVYAADLWETYNNRGPDEYRDPSLFFQKTYLTEGLKNLINSVKNRIEGKIADPVIQIQTPFGGGKTHSLIALLHKAKEWNIKTSVIVGTDLEGNEKLWNILAKQLTGNDNLLNENTSPGKEKLKQLLKQYSPIIILIDELLEYVVKAAAIKIGDSNLASQTLAFIQELTEVISSIEKSCLIITIPASLLEHYDENSQKFYEQLQKITGRVERIYTPVNDSEISKVIRQRLFQSVDNNKVEEVVGKFMEYAQRENILPVGVAPLEYRKKFIDSYPFMPEVIDVLYGRWGSFPNFQRTRGVLRLLALAINNLIDKNIPYISLADIPLNITDIRAELIKNIGPEFNSIIAQDITDINSGSNTIENNLGSSYKGLNLSKRTSTTIFMYSFSGGIEKGATINDIKRSATTLNNPSSLISEIVEQLKNKLFYLQYSDDKYYFSNKPNLNKIILNKMENFSDVDSEKVEYEILKEEISGKIFKTYLWEENSAKINDFEELKLIILKNENKQIIENIIKFKGQTPRINCNTVFFLFPNEMEKTSLSLLIKKFLAFKSLENDTSFNFSTEENRNIKNNIENLKKDIKEQIKKIYRIIAIPKKDSYKKDYLGIPTYGDNRKIDELIFEYLKNQNEILENIAPIVIQEKYLKDKDHISTKGLLILFFTTPGEPRLVSKETLEKAIKEGVEKGFFGLGEIKGENVIVKYCKEKPSISFIDNEIIINEKVCNSYKTNLIDENSTPIEVTSKNINIDPNNKLPIENQTFEENSNIDINKKEELKISFFLPKGKVYDISKILSFLSTKFEFLNISIFASKGELSNQEYQNKIIEAFNQLGIELKEKE